MDDIRKLEDIIDEWQMRFESLKDVVRNAILEIERGQRDKAYKILCDAMEEIADGG